jgi:hypothetical protein
MALASADVEGDGDIDIVAGDARTVGTDSTSDVVLLRNGLTDAPGTPPWTPETLISASTDVIPESPPYYPPSATTPPTATNLSGWGLAFGDADGDGDQDLFVTDRAGYLYIYAQDGAGDFAPIRFESIATRPYAYAYIGAFDALSVAAGDINGDGRCDFAVGYAAAAYDGKIGVYLNEGLSGGKPRFTNAGVIGGDGVDSRGLAMGQLNALDDSYLDIVFGTGQGLVHGLLADLTDSDVDGIVDRFDNIADVANFPTIDLNGDGGLNRLDQIDLDGDGLGSVMSGGMLMGDPDADGDGMPNTVDNLPFVPNADQLDRDMDGVGEVDGPWPLFTLGDPLDDRDPDGDGIPNGPFDPALKARHSAAKQKMMTGETPIILRIDALGRLWQAEFTQTLSDSVCLDEATFAAKYPKNWDGTWGAPNPAGTTPPGPGLEGGKELPVSLVLIPKMLWTDPPVIGYINDRLQYPTFELGQHGTYHGLLQEPGADSSEMSGFDPLEMFVYMRVGQDTMLGVYDRPGGSDYLSAVGGNPAIDWSGAANPLVSFAPPYDEYDVAGAEATARLGYIALSSDIWAESELDDTLMGADYSDQFDMFGALHAAANFMPWGKLDDIPWWAFEPEHATYADYIASHIVPGQANVILIEEVNFSGRSDPATVNNTVDPEKWANFQTMLEVVKDFEGGVPMTLGEYAMARAYDNAPRVYNPDQADENHNGVGDVAEPSISVMPSTQTVQYSDPVGEIVASATDPDNNDVFINHSALPVDLAPVWEISAIQVPWGADRDLGIGGLVHVPAGDYPIDFWATDIDGGISPTVTSTLVTTPEDADVEFDGDNPTALVVDADGDSESFSLALRVSEPDDGNPGDITLAEVTVRLVPVGIGPSAVAPVTAPDATGQVVVHFDDVPVNVYSVEVTVDGGYYVGFGEDTLTVYDPASGNSSGGGWFAWPEDGDKTSFGFTGSYAKKGGPRGGLVVIRHTDEGNYRIKSNALLGYAVGVSGVGADRFGWATLTGKCTYAEPEWETAQGNYTFTLYAEDHGEPGTSDRVWIEVKDRSGTRVAVMSLDAPAVGRAQLLAGGNISVPMKRK